MSELFGGTKQASYWSIYQSMCGYSSKTASQRLSEAREDVKRINWLEQHDGRFYNMDKISSVVGQGFSSDGYRTRFTSIRQAIDFRIASEKDYTCGPNLPKPFDRNTVIEECARVCDAMSNAWGAGPNRCAEQLRALKSKPAAHNPRDELIEKCRLAIMCILDTADAPYTTEEQAIVMLQEALAAIDAALGKE